MYSYVCNYRSLEFKIEFHETQFNKGRSSENDQQKRIRSALFDDIESTINCDSSSGQKRRT